MNTNEKESFHVNDTSKTAFLNIYMNSKQSHSTGALVTTASSAPHVAKYKNSIERELSSPKHAPSLNDHDREKPQSHLFDFYSYYNNKYNQENERKKSTRSISIANTGQYKQCDTKLGSSYDAENSYFMSDYSQFNMKKFASSL